MFPFIHEYGRERGNEYKHEILIHLQSLSFEDREEDTLIRVSSFRNFISFLFF